MTETKFVFRAIPSQSPPSLPSHPHVPIRGRQSEGPGPNHNNVVLPTTLKNTHNLNQRFPPLPTYSCSSFLVFNGFCRLFPPSSSPSSSPCLFLFLPRLLSLWHARWFDIASRCQTTRPYFPSAVPSPLSLSLSFYLPNPLLTTIQFNLQQGLSGTAAGLPHHFFLPARGFAAVCRSPPMAHPVVRPPHFLKLFIC